MNSPNRDLLARASVLATVSVVALVGSLLLARWHWRSQDFEARALEAYESEDFATAFELLSPASSNPSSSGLWCLAATAVEQQRFETAERAAELAILTSAAVEQRAQRDVILARADLGRFERARRQAALGAGDPTILRAATTALRDAIAHLRDAARRANSEDSIHRDLERALRLQAAYEQANAGDQPDKPDENQTSIDLGPEGGEEDPNGNRETEETEIGGSELDAQVGERLQTLAEKLDREIEERRALRRAAFERRTRGRQDW
ncbi:MAG: hypothetical protein AAF196_12460 [Planctomycetota bacterium]